MAAAGGAGGGGGGGGGTGSLPAEYTLAFGDIEWEKDEDEEKVELGRGSSGIVYAGRLHGQPVAIKHEAIPEVDPDGAAAWTKTVVLHMRAKCPHIAFMHGAVVRPSKAGSTASYYTVMERMAGTMTDLLLIAGSVYYGADMALRLHLLADVAGGLAYLHAASAIHGDVKPDNVLLTAVTPESPLPAAKLADFGSSLLRREGTKTRNTMMGERGSLLYMDPRLFDPAASITAASDVYSFGIMAWQVLSGLEPYKVELAEVLPPTATGLQMMDAMRRYAVGCGRPPVAVLVERGVPPAVVALVESCWAPEQASRPVMAEVQRALQECVDPRTATVPAELPPPVMLDLKVGEYTDTKRLREESERRGSGVEGEAAARRDAEHREAEIRASSKETFFSMTKGFKVGGKRLW